MKKIVISFSFFTLVATAICGQNVSLANERVIWSANEACHAKSSVQAKAEGPHCSLVEVNGYSFYIIRHRGISFATRSIDYYGSIVVTLQITNSSGAEIYVDPFKWSVQTYRNEEEFLAGAGDIGISTPVPPNKMANREVTVLEGTTTKAPTGVTRESVLKTSTSPTPGGTVTLTKRVKPFWTFANNALKVGPVPDRNKVAGYFFFDSDGKPRFKVLVMKLDNLNMVFPIVTK